MSIFKQNLQTQQLKEAFAESSSKSKGFSLTKLLDGHTHGDLVHIAYQPDLDVESALGLNPKRKRRKKQLKR